MMYLVTEPGFGVGRLFEELEDAGHRLMLIPVWPGLGLVTMRNGVEE